MPPTTPPTMAPVCESDDFFEPEEDDPADGFGVEIWVVSTTVEVCPLSVILWRSDQRSNVSGSAIAHCGTIVGRRAGKKGETLT